MKLIEIYYILLLSLAVLNTSLWGNKRIVYRQHMAENHLLKVIQYMFKYLKSCPCTVVELQPKFVVKKKVRISNVGSSTRFCAFNLDFDAHYLWINYLFVHWGLK